MLVALGQQSLAKVELRRLLELVFWVIYFTHHPREWEHFDGKRMMGFTKDTSKPIGYAAHRDLTFYFSYAKEYMEQEHSGEAVKAIQELEDIKQRLNAEVHAGQIARKPQHAIPFDTLDETEIRAFASFLRRALSALMVLLLAFDRKSFQQMQAGPRAYFDWLVGTERAKSIRSRDFGLAVTSPL